MKLDFSGQVAVISGGASGIGEACARVLAEAGARVVVADRNEAAARAVAEAVGGIALGAWAAEFCQARMRLFVCA